jgi:hypothetical protein
MSRLGFLTVLAVACGPCAAAQTLRGDVRARETQLPLPFSTIVLQPGGAGRFTNDSGVFAFADLAPGDYRLVVRAIGYLPFDTTITVIDEPIVLHVVLRSVGIELPPVIVIARACLDPGPPRDSQPELATIFDQLRENAARYRLLSDQYPFRYWIRRVTWDEPRARAGDSVSVDTLELRSDARTPYKPGGLITSQPGRRGTERTLRLPTVIDLADSVFHAAHCFSFGGVDSVNGKPQWRVDFLSDEGLRAPDVAGSAWLDSASYQLSRLTFHLTRPERAAKSLQSLQVTVAFGELLPSLTVPIHVTAISKAKARRPITGFEEQRLLRVHYLRGAPGNQSP